MSVLERKASGRMPDASGLEARPPYEKKSFTFSNTFRSCETFSP